MKSNLFKIVSIMIFTVSIANASSTYWLGTNVQIDGSLQSQNAVPIATDFQATASSIETFIYFGDTSSTVVNNGLDYLLANHNNSTEQLARIIQIQAQVSTINQVFIDDLLSRINTDGGIGEDIGFSSNVLDSAWALLAFSAAGNIDQQVLEDMITFIKSRVNTDYGYSNFESNESSVYVSSIVNLAFNKYKNIFTTLITDTSQINQFLIGQQLIEGGWSEIHETAIALIALTATNYNPSTYWLGVLSLRNAKTGLTSFNTNWNEEVYTTALALMAEGLTAGISAPTSSGSVIGHVLDSSTKQSLNGVKVTLDGLSYKVDYSDALGIFNFANISNANHSLEIVYPGYITETVNFEIVDGSNLNIGEIQLIKNPNTGLIKGIVTDGETGSPRSGVKIEVNSGINQSVYTDTQGRYQVEVQPSAFDVTASYSQRNSVFAEATISAGQVIDFSPTLYINGIGISQAQIIGEVKDTQSGELLENVQINLNGSTYFTDIDGNFNIVDINLGLVELTLSAVGYHDLPITLLASSGIVNLGTLSMTPMNQASSSRVFGTVKEGNLALTGVEVSIVGTSLTTLTDNNGIYEINGIAQPSYQVHFSNAGYESLFFDISSQQHSTSELNVTLDSIGSSSLKILEFLPEKFVYTGIGEVELDIELNNATQYNPISTRLYLQVTDSNDKIISSFALKEIPFGGTNLDASETLEPRETRAIKAMWNTIYKQPGDYTITLLAYDVDSIILLNQASTLITILASKAIDGSVQFSPNNTHFDPALPIQISAELTDVGTNIIGSTQVTANVYLTDKEDTSSGITASRVKEYTDPLLITPNLMKKNSLDELLIYNANISSRDIIKFKSDESFETLFNVGPISDFSLNTIDEVHTITSSCVVKKYDATGNILSSFNLGLNYCKYLEVLNDDVNVYVTSDDGVHNLEMSTGLVTQIAGNYLQNPQGMIRHTDGRLLIVDSGTNMIMSYQNDSLTTWIDTLDNPRGLCEDTDGSVIVANYGADEIIRVLADGSIATIVSGINKPFDVKLNPNGGYFVSSETDNKLYQVNADGSSFVIYDSFINKPEKIAAGNNGDVYIYNSIGKTIVHRLSDGTTTIIATAPSRIYSLTVNNNDELIVNMSSNLYRVEPDGSFNEISNGMGTTGFIETNLSNEIIYSSSQKSISKINASGTIVSDYIHQPFENIRAVQTDSTGLSYVLDSSGNITTVDQNQNYQRLISGLGSVIDLYISSSDGLYVAKSDKSVIHIDNLFNITTIATLDNVPTDIVVNSMGEIIYSDAGLNLYINDGTMESIYMTLDTQTNGDLAIDSMDRLWVTYGNQSNKITQINNNLSTYEINSNGAITDIARPNFIQMDYTNNSVWISDQNGVFFIDSLGTVSNILSSPSAPTTSIPVVSGTQIYLFSTYYLHLFDVSLTYQKTYTTFRSIRDLAVQDNGELVLSINTPYEGLIKYVAANKLPERITNGRYYDISPSTDSNHILALTYNTLKNINLTTGQEIDIAPVSGELSKIVQINNNEIHLVDYSNNKYNVYNFQGDSLFNLFGLNSLQGIAVSEQGKVYITDAENIYKYININEIELVVSQYAGGFLEINGDTLLKSHTFSTFVVIDVNTAESNTYRLSHVERVTSLVYENDNNIKAVGPLGLVQTTILGESTPLLNSVNNPGDVVQLDNGEIFISSSFTSTTNNGILKISNGVLSLHKSNLDLHNIRSNKLTIDNGVLYAYNNGGVDLIKTGTEDIKISNPFAFSFKNLVSTVVIGNDIYALTRESILYKSRMFDASIQTPFIGDLIHTTSKNITINQGEMINVIFDNFNAPIAGDYSVVLSFADPEINSELSDQLHVGNVAKGSLQVAGVNLSPGDSSLASSMYIDGIDTRSLVELTKEDTLVEYIYNDSIGYISEYETTSNGDIIYIKGNTRQIYKFEKATQSNSLIFETDYTIRDLIVDNNDNILLVGDGNIAFQSTTIIDTNGVVLGVKDYKSLYGIRGIRAGDIDINNNLLLLALMPGAPSLEYSVVKIDNIQNTMVLVKNNVLPESTLSTTLNENIYIMGSSIYEIDQNNNTTRLYEKQLRREGGSPLSESFRNVVSVCDGTPIYTDYDGRNEEYQLYSGAIRSDLVYEGTDKNIYTRPFGADLDSLYYDQFTSTLLLNDHNWYNVGTNYNGRLISIPVNCGKMYVELHLTDQTNTSLNSFDISPNQTIEVGPNTYEYVWSIDGLDEVQRIFNFQTQIDNLLPNESRPILSSAYLKFKNSLDPQQDLVVNIDIPSILGVIDRTLNVALDNTQYSSNTDIQITNTVNNTAAITFNGSIVQQIEDAQGNLVTALAPINVANLAPTTQLDFPEVWNTLNYYAGDYTLVSKLYDDVGDLQDEKTTAFSIVPNAVNNTTTSLRVLTNKVQYTSYDLVEISPSVTNLSNNNILTNHTAQLLVTAPNGMIVFQQTTAINNLSTNAIQNWQHQLPLNNAALGLYAISLNLIDESGVIVANETIGFEVILDEQQVLTGLVVTAFTNIQPGTDNTCHYELTNSSSQSINSIEIHQTVANLSNQLTMQDDVVNINLNAGASWNNQQIIPTTQLSSGDHACILRTIINGKETTQASSIFFVQGANHITGNIWNDEDANGIHDLQETGIAGVEITLLDQAQTPLQTVNTDIDGYFVFTPVFNGEYTLQVTETGLLDTYINTTSNNPQLLNVINGHQNIKFGYQQTIQYGSVEGLIFEDINGDGIQSIGEVGIVGVSLELSSTTQTLNTTTDVKGAYQFTQLIADNYVTTVTDNSGILTYYQLTTANQPFGLSVIENQINTTGVFGYQAHLSSILGKVFKDDNGNGLQDTGETGYANVTIELTGTETQQVTSNASGSYEFNQLATGQYTVSVSDINNVLINNQLTSASSSYPVSLGTNQSETTGNFAYQLHNSGISGLVFNDSNGNGTQDTGETGITQITVDLIQNTNVITTFTTQADGNYSFNQLLAGSYEVVISDTNGILPQTQLTTGNQPYAVTLAENENLSLINYGYQYHNSGVSGIVFNDSNGNGTQDTGEAGYSGITLDVLQNTNVIVSFTTIADGSYQFAQLVAGDYEISITDTANVLVNTQLTSNNQPLTLTLVENQNTSNIHFAYQLHNSGITGIVFNDSNGNGIQDTGEVGYPNVTLELTDSTITPITATTDVTGTYTYTGLVAGSYTTTVTDSNNVLQNSQLTSSNQPYQITVAENASDTTGNFAYQLHNSGISGLIFNDSNGNGILDTGETGYAGVTIDLIQNANVLTTFTTQADGIYNFNQLVAGDYEVVISDTNGVLLQTQLTTGNQPYAVTLAENENISLINYGYQYHNSGASGIVFNDSNGNGIYEPGEPYLSNIGLELTNTDTQLTQTTQTDVSGQYQFSQLIAGNYSMAVTDTDLLTNWINTSFNNPSQIALNTFDTQTINFAFGKIEVNAQIIDSDGKGRILILMNPPTNTINTSSCIGIHAWRLQKDIHTPLDANTQITARLYNSNGDLIETESTLVSDFNTDIDDQNNATEANLILQQINFNQIFVKVATQDNDEYATLANNYRVELQIDNNTETQIWSSQPIIASCDTSQSEGQTSGDFTIAEITPAPKPPTDEPNGPDQAEPLIQQKIFLQNLLDASGWSYTMTENIDDFQTQFETGVYVMYIILSENSNLSKDFQEDLKEAMKVGEGLIIASGYDNHNEELYDELGIEIKGVYDNATGIEFEDSPLTSQTIEAINLDETVLKVEIDDDTKSVGVFTGIDEDEDERIALAYLRGECEDDDHDDKSISIKSDDDDENDCEDSEQGRGVFAAFDLLLQATHLDQLSTYSSLLENAINYVHNAVVAGQLGKAQKLTLHIDNLGIDFIGHVQWILPSGLHLLQASLNYTETNNIITLEFDTQNTPSIDITLWFVLDESPQDISFEILDPDNQVLQAVTAILTATEVDGDDEDDDDGEDDD